MPRRAAERGEGGEVWIVERRLPHVVFGGALLLADLAERGVVEQHVFDGDAVLHRRRHLPHVLTEATVPCHGDDRTFRCCGPGSEGGRISEPDRSEIARHQHVLAAGFEVAPERVGVVADVDTDDSVRRAMPTQGVEDCRRRHAACRPCRQPVVPSRRARGSNDRRGPDADRPAPPLIATRGARRSRRG